MGKCLPRGHKGLRIGTISILVSAIFTVGHSNDSVAQSKSSGPDAVLPTVEVQTQADKPKPTRHKTSVIKTVSQSTSSDHQATSLKTSETAAEADAHHSSALNIGSPIAGYSAANSSAALKTDTPLMQTPGSVSVVTRQQIIDQDAQSVAQALRYTPGVVAEQRGINTDSLEYLYSRGFQADTYLDGLRQPSSGQAGFNMTSRDAYLIDHIESIRGPASILYGQAPPGGVFNIVSKMPQGTSFNEAFFQTGSYGLLEGGFDTTGPANADKSLLYRVTGVGLTTNTQTDFVERQRIAIAPSFTWKIDPATKITVLASYQDDPKAGIYGFVPAAGTVLPGVRIPRSMYLGEPSFDRYRKEDASIGYQFEHQLDSVWQVKQNFRYTHNDIYIQEAGPSGAFADNGTTLLRTAYINSGVLDAFTVDNEAIAKFSTGFMRHDVLTGIDYQNTEYDHDFYYGYNNGASVPSLSLTNPVYGVSVPTPNFVMPTAGDANFQQIGIYGQDQIEIENLSIVGGIRQDWAKSFNHPYRAGLSDTDQDSSATTGRAGAIYNFDNGLAPYFSYATSFQPLAGTTDTGAPLKPTEGEQYEVGFKYQPPGTNSIFTMAAYDLRQTNVTVSNADYVGSITQTGEVRSRGIELEARGDITQNLHTIASYTYDDVENTEATAAIQGKAPVGIPMNMASLFLSYDVPSSFAPGLKLSGGVRYLGDTWGDTSNTFKVPSATLFDFGLQYDFGHQFAALQGVTWNINVTNLFDKDYISSCLGTASCTYGAGRMVLTGLKYRW